MWKSSTGTRMIGQIIDVEKKDGGFDDNPGGSGPGGAHMRFAAAIKARVDTGTIDPAGGPRPHSRSQRGWSSSHGGHRLQPRLMNFDRAIDPAKRCEEILAKAAAKPWSDLLAAHLAEHRAMFDRVSLQLDEPDAKTRPSHRCPAPSGETRRRRSRADRASFPVRTLPAHGQLAAARPLPANLQGIWNDKKWARGNRTTISTSISR